MVILLLFIIDNITSLYESNPKEVRRFVKFGIVGVLGAAIDFALLNILRGVFGWDLLWANTVSVCVAIISNFTWNRLWTYPESRARKKRTQLPQFTLVNLIGLIINNVIVLGVDSLVVGMLGEPWSYNIAKIVAIGVVFFWNFIINRLWTYRGL
ncbi:MAG: GtrA family protein [Anaerolineae bacterium]|nr:GtrA family protein [Anaerolineae bacterium]